MTATELPETKAYLRLPADLLYVKSDSGIAVRAGAAAIMLQGDDARAVVTLLFPLFDGPPPAAGPCARLRPAKVLLPGDPHRAAPAAAAIRAAGVGAIRSSLQDLDGVD